MIRFILFLLMVICHAWTSSSTWAQSTSLAQLHADIRQAPTPDDRLPLLIQAAEVAYHNGNESAGRNYAQLAEKTIPKVTNSRLLARAYYGLGSILRNERQYQSAIPYFEKAIGHLKSQFDQEPNRAVAARLSICHQDLGICYEQVDQDQKMEQNLRYAVVYARQYAKDPQIAANAYLALGEAYRRLEDYPSAEKAFQFALSEAKKAQDIETMEKAARKLETIGDFLRITRPVEP